MYSTDKTDSDKMKERMSMNCINVGRGIQSGHSRNSKNSGKWRVVYEFESVDLIIVFKTFNNSI